MDLSTTYLGLKLANPLLPGALPMGDALETARKLVDHGAAAVMMPPIYEEQITDERTDRLWYEKMHADGAPGSRVGRDPGDVPRHYLERIAALKQVAKAPLIASINCTTAGKWCQYASAIESAGADALELSVHILPTNPDEPANSVEQRLIDIVSSVRARVKLPLAVKLSPFYTSLPHLLKQLEAAGAGGLVLFNRFYQPDFEPAGGGSAMAAQMRMAQSADPHELRLRLSWLAILSPQTRASLALAGGVQTGLEVIKGIMAGAHAVQVGAPLLNTDPEYMETVLEGLVHHMQQAGAESVQKLRGCMNYSPGADAASRQRNTCFPAFQGWMAGKSRRESLQA